MTNNHRYCVIMCGGIGSRFWPYSRTARPKQFIDFFGIGRSLLQMSYDRILPVVPKENILILTNRIYADIVAEQLPDLDPSQILLEPARRNTAPCIAWAAYHISARDPEASMIVMPSDHLIIREQMFQDSIRVGFDFIEKNNALLTLGIKPSRPETGYGYIQLGVNFAGNISKVKTFTEKPELEIAKSFIASGEFCWNAGIFIWKAQTILNSLNRFAPDIIHVLSEGSSSFATRNEQKFIDENFQNCPSISIDYAVLEKEKNVYVEQVDIGWNDLGTWSALYENSPKNPARNVTQNCQVLAYNSTDNIFAIKDDKLVVVSGLNNFIVADSGDVLLICPRSDEQRIKSFVNDIRIKYKDKYI